MRAQSSLKLLAFSSFLWVAPLLAAANEPAGQCVGFYSNGSLINSTPIAADGPGWTHLFIPRNRGWGTQGLVEAIETVATQIATLFPDGERLQLGDLSGASGGFISGHTSHQNGLDVDFIYFRRNHKEQSPSWQDGFIESFVVNGKVSPNFDVERNWQLFSLLVETGRINRIFVDPVIKRFYCARHRIEEQGEQEDQNNAYSSRDQRVLHHLRPLANHDDHTHVRLTCPEESTQCIAQEPIPAGAGCKTKDFLPVPPSILSVEIGD